MFAQFRTSARRQSLRWRAMSEPEFAVTYPEGLPVSQRRDDILDALRQNQVLIVAGATGSGKTTQIPKMLLELGKKSIGHTQPRRIAARTIAERIAEELGQEVGELVGYQVRFTDRVGKSTRIKLMTDGILLNEIHRDRNLTKYDAIIIDEAHERSLTVDFLIGYLKQLLPRRPDLTVVITSATIDPESFAKHFAAVDGTPAPIIEVSGRTFPVEIRYRPLVAEVDGVDGFELEADNAEDAAGNAVDRDYLQGINDAIDELGREGSGDVLVFLSGEAEIRDAEESVRGRNLPGTEVLPLYGRLSAADQHKVFQPSTAAGTRRRIVLATNVAETSLTVPGIRYVIDAGTARISRYSVRSKIQRLPIEAISQASANQRSGRSGRTSDGIAIRLYSEEDFTKRPEFTEPEILRTNLAAVILQMISLGLGDIAAFPFLQPPDSRGVKDGLDLLRELSAVTPDHHITKVGKQLAQLPIDPRLGRMIIESKQHGTTREVMAIVAGLSIQDPRERPLEKRTQADQQHARFTDPTSDFISLLNLWNYLEETQKQVSGNQFRRRCRSEYLNYLRVREWQDVYRQLTRLTKQLSLTVNDPAVNPDGIHRSVLAGLLSHIGLKDVSKKDYVGARQSRFVIFPGSALAKKQPPAVMSAELVETSRLFARMNAVIDPAWAEPIAGDLVKRSYSEPRWEKKQGSVVADERVTLYGVPIVARRRIQFARIDAAYARDLFIRNALVDGDWDLSRTDRRLTAFYRANSALRAEIEELEERTRTRTILFDDEVVYSFYAARIPADVASLKSFETWWRTARAVTPDLLTMTRDQLIEEDAVPVINERDFPATWQQGEQQLSLTYRFDPGSEEDGVTVRIPLPLLASVRSTGFDWLVPGLRTELVAALLKSLPKPIRRNVVPANDWARRFVEEIPADPDVESMPLVEYLAKLIRSVTYTPVDAEDFDLDRVPDHLKATFAVLDDRGAITARSKDLSSLRLKLARRTRESVATVTTAPHGVTPRRDIQSNSLERAGLERTGLTTWDFDTLPRTLDSKHSGGVVRAYPALVDAGSSVEIRVQSSEADQFVAHRGGVRRLLQLSIPSPTSYVQEHLTAAEKLSLATSPYRSNAELFDDCLAACIDAVVDSGEIFTRQQFEVARESVNTTIVDAMFGAVSTVSRVLLAAREADRAISGASSMALMSPLADARAQLAALVHPGFVSTAGLGQLRRMPVYLEAISHRVSKLADNVGRDRTWSADIDEATRRYVSAGGELPVEPDAAEHIRHARWMLEELRLSLFAQHLPTAETVSLQRITKVLGGG
ncbi:MAG: ATP-dependent RNA helicase HrpA [Microbacteriaceae bacterium]